MNIKLYETIELLEHQLHSMAATLELKHQESIQLKTYVSELLKQNEELSELVNQQQSSFQQMEQQYKDELYILNKQIYLMGQDAKAPVLTQQQQIHALLRGLSVANQETEELRNKLLKKSHIETEMHKINTEIQQARYTQPNKHMIYKHNRIPSLPDVISTRQSVNKAVNRMPGISPSLHRPPSVSPIRRNISSKGFDTRAH